MQRGRAASTNSLSASNPTAEEKNQVRVTYATSPIAGYDEEMSTLFAFTVHIVEATNLLSADLGGSSDPFCTLLVDILVLPHLIHCIGKIQVGQVAHKTHVVKRTLNPKWDEKFVFYCLTPEKVIFRVFDEDRFGKPDPLGDAEVDSASYFARDEASKFGVLLEAKLDLKNVPKVRGSISVKIIFRKIWPLKTERRLHQAEQSLSILAAQRVRSGSTSPLDPIPDSIKSQLESKERELSELRTQNEALKLQISNLRDEVGKTLSSALMSRELTPGEAGRELSQALIKVSTLEQQNRMLIAEKLDLQNKISQLEDHDESVTDGPSSLTGIVIPGPIPCCVVCGVQCVLM